jgi:hypothetical protein
MEILMDHLQHGPMFVFIAKYGQFMSFSMEKSMETSIFDGKIWENHDQNMIKTIGFSDFPVVFRWFSSPSGVVPVVWRPGVAGVVCWPLQSRSWKIRNIPGER